MNEKNYNQTNDDRLTVEIPTEIQAGRGYEGCYTQLAVGAAVSLPASSFAVQSVSVALPAAAASFGL